MVHQRQRKQRNTALLAGVVVATILMAMALPSAQAALNEDLDAGDLKFNYVSEGTTHECKVDFESISAQERDAAFFVKVQLTVEEETSTQMDTWLGQLTVQINEGPLFESPVISDSSYNSIEDRYGEDDSGRSVEISVLMEESNFALPGEYSLTVLVEGWHTEARWPEGQSASETMEQSSEMPAPPSQSPDCTGSKEFTLTWGGL